LRRARSRNITPLVICVLLAVALISPATASADLHINCRGSATGSACRSTAQTGTR
jgi:hypothetical protein